MVNITLTIPYVIFSSILTPHNNIATIQPTNVNLTTIPSNPSTGFQPSTTNSPPSLSFPSIPIDLLSNSMSSSLLNLFGIHKRMDVEDEAKMEGLFEKFLDKKLRGVI